MSDELLLSSASISSPDDLVLHGRMPREMVTVRRRSSGADVRRTMADSALRSKVTAYALHVPLNDTMRFNTIQRDCFSI